MKQLMTLMKPTCDEALSFIKVTNLPTGRRLDTPNEDTPKKHVVLFPCQGAEHDLETVESFHRLLDDARDYLQVVSMHDA